MLLRPAFLFAGEMLTFLRKLSGLLKLTTSGTWKTLQPRWTTQKSCLLKLRDPLTTLCILTPTSNELSNSLWIPAYPVLTCERGDLVSFLPFLPPLVFFLPLSSCPFAPWPHPVYSKCTSFCTPYPFSPPVCLFQWQPVPYMIIYYAILCFLSGCPSTLHFQLLAALLHFALF